MGMNVLEQIVAELPEARVLRIAPLKGRYFILRLAVGDETVEFTALASELLSQSKQPRPQRYKPERGKLNRAQQGQSVFAQKSHWSEAELWREGLPLYWNEAWLRAELERLGSFMAIEKEYGYPNNTLSGFARREFGIQRRPRQRDKK